MIITPKKPQFFVINSFPRSGSNFLFEMIRKHSMLFTFEEDGIDYVDKFCEFQVLHIPYIITNPDIMTISILRDPYDAIASYAYAKLETANVDTSKHDNLVNESTLTFYVNTYIEFLNAIEQSLDREKFLLVDFAKMVATPNKVFSEVVTKFNLYSHMNCRYTDEEITTIIRDHFFEKNLMKRQESYMPLEEKDLIRDMVFAEVKNNKKLIDPAYKQYKKLLKFAK